MNVLRFYIQKMYFIIIVSILVLMMCEIYTRLPLILQKLEYQIDNELVAILKSNQEGFTWLGNMSYKSPLIRINNDGDRGRETDWSKPVLLCAGNSEAFGAGVEDNEVWTSRLEDLLKKESSLEDVQVVNAAHLGHGPYQHYVRIRRIIEKHSIQAIIVRVDLADRYFRPVPPDQLSKSLKMAILRQTLRKYTKGTAFLLNKLNAQLPSIKRSLKPHIEQRKRDRKTDSSDGVLMLSENKIWWGKIIELARQENIPIIFMVYNMWDSPGTKVIKEGLCGLKSEYQSLFLLELTPTMFGIGPEITSTQKEAVLKKLLLERDPHASAYQHEIIAQEVYRFLKNNDLISDVFSLRTE